MPIEYTGPMRATLLFLLAGLLEIGGGYLVWLWLREHRHVALGVAGLAALALYGIVPVLQESAHPFGRVYAAYGAVFIVLSVLWGWCIDGHRPDLRDWVGAAICVAGATVMMWPRGAELRVFVALSAPHALSHPAPPRYAPRCLREGETMSSYAEKRAEALDKLAAGDARGAFGIFRWTLEYAGVDAGDDHFSDAVGVLARIAEPIAGDDLAAGMRRVASDPDDVQALYDLGYELIEQGLHGIAATVLARAYAREPAEQVLTELVAALERDGNNPAARRFLEGAPELTETSFVCRYLLAFNALMTADIETPRRLLPGLEELLASDPDAPEGFPFMRNAIRDLLARADAVRAATPLDAMDLRGWHFVVSGGLLLHLSPFGFEDAMRGRYAFTQDSDDRMLEGLLRLRAALAAWDVRPPRVFTLPDRESEILGLAASMVLDIARAPWPAGGTEEPGLVVAYDLAGLEEPVIRSLHPHRPGQILFAHASCWTSEPPFAADVTTYLYQVNQSPWGERLRFDSESGKTVTAPPLEGDTSMLARKVFEAKLEDGALADLATLDALAKAAAGLRGDAAAGALRTSGTRRRQREDSPVKSNRF